SERPLWRGAVARLVAVQLPVQHDPPARCLGAVWADQSRPADRTADRRPALCRGPRAARRPHLRDDPARAPPAAVRHMSAPHHLLLTLTDAPDEAQKAVISQGLGAYNDAVGGAGDYKP